MPNLSIPNDPEWQWVYDLILYTVGEEFPEADPAALRAMAQELQTTGGLVLSHIDAAASLSRDLQSSLEGPAAEAFAGFAANITNGLPVGGDIANALAFSADEFALDSEATQYGIVIAAFTIVVEIAIALATGFGAAAVPGLIKIGQQITRQMLDLFKDRLQNLLLRTGLEALEEAAQEMAETIAAQAIQFIEGNRRTADGQDILMSGAGGAFIGGGVAGVFGLIQKYFPNINRQLFSREAIMAGLETVFEGLFTLMVHGNFNPFATAISSMAGGYASARAHQWSDLKVAEALGNPPPERGRGNVPPSTGAANIPPAGVASQPSTTSGGSSGSTTDSTPTTSSTTPATGDTQTTSGSTAATGGTASTVTSGTGSTSGNGTTADGTARVTSTDAPVTTAPRPGTDTSSFFTGAPSAGTPVVPSSGNAGSPAAAPAIGSPSPAPGTSGSSTPATGGSTAPTAGGSTAPTASGPTSTDAPVAAAPPRGNDSTPASTTPSAPAAGSPAPAASTSGSDVPAGNTSATPPPASAGVAGSTGLTTDLSSPTARPEGLAGFDSPTSTTTGASTTSAGLDAPASPVSGTNAPSTAPATVGASNTSTSGGTGPSSTASSGTTSGSTASSGTTSGSTASSGTTSGSTASSGTGPSSTASSGTTSSTSTSSSAGARNSAETGSASGRSDLTTPAQALPPENLTVATDLPAPPAASAPPASPVPVEIGLPGLESLGIPAAAPAPTPAPASPSPVPAPAVRKTPDQVAASSPTRTVQVGRHRVLVRSQPGRWREQFVLVSESEWAQIANRPLLPDGDHIAHTALIVHGGADNTITVPVELPDGFHGTAQLTPAETATLLAQLAPATQTWVLAACASGDIDGGFAQQTADAAAVDILAPAGAIAVGADVPGNIATEHGTSWQLHVPAATGTAGWDVINDHSPFDGIKAIRDKSGSGLRMAPERPTGPRSPRPLPPASATAPRAARPATPEEQPVEDTSAGRPETVNPLPTAPEPVDGDSASVTLSLTNLHLLLEHRPSWAPGWAVEFRGQRLRRAATAFGRHFAADLAGRLTGRPVAPGNVTDFLSIESVAAVQGLANLIFLQAAAAAEGTFEPLPMRSLRPIAEVVDLLDPVPQGFDPAAPDALTLRGAGAFLRANEAVFREQLARQLSEHLDRSVDAADLVLDPPVPDGPAGGRSAPAAIEVELLRGTPQRTPLGLADAELLFRVAEQHGTESRRARELSGRSPGDLRDRHRLLEKGGADARSAPQRFGHFESPRRLPNGVLAYLPDGDEVARAFEVLDLAEQLPSSPGTLTVTGIARGAGSEVAITDGTGGIIPDLLVAEPFVANAAQGGREHPVLVLRLLDNRQAAETIARQTQSLIDRDTLLGGTGPRGVVVGVPDPTTGRWSWQAAIPGSERLQPTGSLDDALTVVRGLPPLRLDPAQELRARVDGHTAHPRLTTAECAQLALQDAGDLPSYSERATDSPDSFAETELRVPVRPGATPGEAVDAARLWLDPEAVREVVSRGDDRATQLVRIGPSLRAHVLRLAGTGTEPDSWASIVRPAESTDRVRYRVWVNRHQPLPGHGGPVSMTAVLPDPHVDWSVLDTLPPSFLSRLTIEPGRVDGDTIDVGEGRPIDAAEYAGRLADTDEPVVVLQAPMHSDAGLPFVRSLSHAGWVLAQRVQDGRREWLMFRDGELVQVIPSPTGRELGQVLRNSAGGPIVTPRQAVHDLLSDAVRTPDAPAALVLQRAMAAAELSDTDTVRGWLTLPPGSLPTGPISTLLGHYPAGLVPLRAEPVQGMVNIPLQVPSRYAAEVTAGGLRQPVADLTALAEARAVVGVDGRVTVPPAVTSRRGVEVIRGHLAGMRAQRPADQPDQRVARLFGMLGHVPRGAGPPSLTAWADQLGAQFREVGPQAVERLGAGAVTLARTRAAGVLIAVGVEDPHRPALLTLGGEPVDPAVLGQDGLQLLLDGDGRMAQIDITVPDMTLPAVRGRPGEDATVSLTDQVADRLRAYGDEVPADLEDRLNRRVSVTAARRLSRLGGHPAVLDVVAQEAVREVDEPVDEEARRTELLSGVVEVLTDNGVTMSVEDVQTHLDVVLAAEPPEWIGSSVPEQMIIRVGLNIAARQAEISMMAAGGVVSRERRARFRAAAEPAPQAEATVPPKTAPPTEIPAQSPSARPLRRKRQLPAAPHASAVDSTPAGHPAQRHAAEQMPTPAAAAELAPSATVPAGAVPADGNCQLYSLIGADPERVHRALTANGLGSAAVHDWLTDPVRVRSDLQRHAQVLSDTAPVPIDSPLAQATDALRDLVVRRLDSYEDRPGDLPIWVVQEYRTAGDGFGPDQLPEGRDELLTQLSENGITTVTNGQMLPVTWLRDRFIERRAAELTSPDLSPTEARRAAEREVPLVDSRPDATPELADDALSMQQMLTYLTTKDGALPAAEAPTSALRDMLSDHYLFNGRPVTRDELATVRHAAANWQNFWLNNVGDTFLPLLAHTLDLRVTVLRGDQHDSTSVGEAHHPQVQLTLEYLHYSYVPPTGATVPQQPAAEQPLAAASRVRGPRPARRTPAGPRPSGQRPASQRLRDVAGLARTEPERDLDESGLNTVVDEIVHQVRGHDDTGDWSLNECVVLSQAFLRRVHPAVAVAAASDDTATNQGGSAGVRARLVAGPGWAQNPDRDRIRELVDDLGDGATVLWAESRQNGADGHVRMWHRADNVVWGIDPQRDGGRVYPVVHPTLDVRAGIAETWVLVIDADGHVATPGPESGHTASALVDAPTNHAYGAHAEEVEVHNLGLFHSGTTLPGKVVVARSNDGLVEVATDFTVLQVGTDDRLAEPRAGGPQRTMTLSIPEINTTPSANLPQEDHRPDHDEVQERVRRTIVLLSNASPMLRLTDQTTSLRSLLPAGEYTIPSEYANVTVARLPEIRPNFPLYVQYTEDVPIAGMYQFLDHVARYARPTGGAEQGLRAAMRFGRQVAALFVERTVQRRPSEGDMEMLLASQPVMSLMGVMAVSAHVVAGGLDHAIIRQGIMRGRLLVAPRHSLQVLWQALGGEIQTFLRQNAAEIRQMFVGNVDWLRRTYNHVYRLHPNTAVNLLGIWMVQDHTLTPTHTAFDVLNQVLDPPANSAGIPSSVFRIGPSHNNGLLNLRPPAPPTAALELRYYGVRPVDGPEIYSSQPMYVSDSGQIRQAARHADTNATMAHRLGATREGRAVTTALVHAIAAEPSDRVQRINALVNAIVVYGHLYPHHESALRTLLAPAEQRLSVQLVPLTGPAAPGGQHHGQFGPAAPLLPSSQGWPPQNFFPPQAQISGPAASSAPDGENPPAPADDLDGTPAGPVPGTLWNAPVEFSTHGITAAVQRPDGSATSVDEDWDDWEKEAAALRAARVPTQVINWARQQAWSATTDEAMRWFRPDEERRRLNVVVEIELPAVDPNESAAGRAAREETEERFSWWATGVVNRQLNLGLSRWGDRAGTAAPQAEVRYAVVRTPRTDARPAPDRLRLRFDGQETMPESPPQSLRQRELILDGAMVLADRNPQTLELTAEARSKVARFTVEVAARAVERHFAGAPGPLVHLVGQFDETGGGDTDDAENDVDEAYEPFRGFLEASVADQLAERLRRDPTTDEVRAVVRTLIVSRSTKPAKNADLARRFAMPVELHLVAPALAPPPLDGEDVRSSDWRSPEPAPTLENPLSSAEVERIAAALPDSAFVLVHLENADVTEPPGDGRTLLRSYRAEGRHDLARVHVEGRGWIRIFRHRIHLAEEQGVSPGVVQQFQEDLTASLQEDVNARFRLPGGDQFHLMVEFVEPERAHLTATVGSTPEGGADTKPVDTEYWPEWLVRRDAGFRRAVLTHEIWHNAFAAPDEYRDAAANGRRSIFRSDAPGARDRRLPRLYELEEGLMGPSRWSPDMIRARYLTRIDFAQRSQVNAPETTVRLTGDTVEVVPQSVLELRRIAERGPAVTNAQLAAEWRYGHALEGMLDDAETNQVYGRTYAVLPRHDADRYLIGDQFLLLTSSRPPENVPAGHRLLVFDSSHLVVHSEGRELRFVPVYSADHDRETDDGTAYLTGPAPAAETSANPAEVPNDSAELPNEPEFDEPPATARDDARLDEAAAWLESPSGYIEDGYPAVPVPHAGRQNPARAADTHKAFINGLDRAISLRRTRTTNNASLPVETLPPPAKEPLATAGGRPFASSALPALVAEVRRSTAQSEDPQLCLVQADAVRSRLFPGGVRLPRAVTDVDAVRLVDANFTEANGWPRVPGFGPVVEGVRAAGVGSAAFVVLERPDGVGHAWVVVHTEDGRIVAVDVDAPAEHDRVTELPADPDQFRAQRVGPLESAVSTRVQLVGPTGAVIDGAFPTVTESQSAARALVDRTPDSRYGALRRGPARSSGRTDAADQRQRDAAPSAQAFSVVTSPMDRARLRDVADGIVTEAPGDDPNACLNRLLVFRDQVFRAIRHQNTSDDSVLGGGRSHPFGMASAWPRVDGLRSIVPAMRDLPAGSAAFVLLDNQDRDKGHAVLLYNVADPATDGSPPRVRTVLVDLNPVRAGQHVTDLDETSDPLDELLTDRIKPATVTRALVVDNTGTVRDVIPTTAPSTSQAQALADPPTNLGYAGSGIEAEFTEIMWLTGISDPKRVRGQSLVIWRTPEGKVGFRVIVETKTYFRGASDRLYRTQDAAKASGGTVWPEDVAIPEFVSEVLADHSAEQEIRLRPDPIWDALEQVEQRFIALDGEDGVRQPATDLETLFQGDGFEITGLGAYTSIGKRPIGDWRGAHFHTTIGVVQSGLYDLLKHVAERTWRDTPRYNTKVHLDDALALGREVAKRYVIARGRGRQALGQISDQDLASLPFPGEDRDAAIIAGHVALLASNASVLAEMEVHRGLGKELLAAASRVALHDALRNLDQNLQDYLAVESDFIWRRFEQSFRERVPTFDERLRVRRGLPDNAPIDLATVLYEAVPFFGESPEVTGTHRRTIREYLNSGLNPRAERIGQSRTLNIGTTLGDLDRVDQDLVVLEVRSYAQRHASVRTARTDHQRLVGVAVAGYDREQAWSAGATPSTAVSAVLAQVDALLAPAQPAGTTDGTGNDPDDFWEAWSDDTAEPRSEWLTPPGSPTDVWFDSDSDDEPIDADQALPALSQNRFSTDEWHFAATAFRGLPPDTDTTPLPSAYTPEQVHQRFPLLRTVNPHHGTDADTNCVIAAITYVLARDEGTPVEASGSTDLPGADLVNFQRQRLNLPDNEHLVWLTPSIEALTDAMQSAGEDTVVLLADRGDTGHITHVYVAEVDHLGVTFLNPQTGQLAALPTSTTALAVLPLTQGMEMPAGGRRLAPSEAGTAAVDESPSGAGTTDHTLVPPQEGISTRLWVTRSGSMLHAPHTGYNATGYPLPPMPQPDPDWENHT
ncbi:WXG100-like domain-containing protein [Micromonospora arida]